MNFFLKKIISYFKRFKLSFLTLSFGNKKARGQYIFQNNISFIFSLNFNSFFSFYNRPKKSNDIKSNSVYLKKKFGIIIQGPIIWDDKFTYESIKIYLKIFPDALVVLSTWKNENIDKIKNIRNKRLIIIKSTLPQDPGPGNINYQIKSVKVALDFLKSKKIEFTLKTRTDSRIYNPYSFVYLLNLMNTFKFTSEKFINERILISSIATCKYRVYGATDITQFGNTLDLCNYWNAPYYEFGLNDLTLNPENPIINNTPILSEIYLCSHFLYRNKIKINWTLDQWWNLCKEYFLVFDAQNIDFFWNKYEKQLEQRFLISYTTHPRSMNFNDWLILLSGKFKSESFLKDHQEKWEYNKNQFNQLNV